MKRKKENSLKLSPKKMRKLRKPLIVTDKELVEKINNSKFFQDKLARANDTLSKITNLHEIFK